MRKGKRQTRKTAKYNDQKKFRHKIEHQIKEEYKTYSMEVYHHPALRVSLQQLRSNSPLQPIRDLTRSDSFDKLNLVLKIHI
jgi:hypothetical protein